jgi:hypothetical protein
MFDPNTTYWQSLKIVARGLIQWPLRSDEIDEVCDAVKAIGYSTVAAITRIICLLTLPISALIIALVIPLYRKDRAKGEV